MRLEALSSVAGVGSDLLCLVAVTSTVVFLLPVLSRLKSVPLLIAKVTKNTGYFFR